MRQYVLTKGNEQMRYYIIFLIDTITGMEVEVERDTNENYIRQKAWNMLLNGNCLKVTVQS